MYVCTMYVYGHHILYNGVFLMRKIDSWQQYMYECMYYVCMVITYYIPDSAKAEGSSIVDEPGEG